MKKQENILQINRLFSFISVYFNFSFSCFSFVFISFLLVLMLVLIFLIIIVWRAYVRDRTIPPLYLFIL